MFHEGQSFSKRRRLAAFTILEVMVAVAILALALTAIFASEAGAVRLHHRARKTAVATLLARCKMGEIEQLLGEEGLPAVEEAGSDACCEGAEHDGYSCDWRVTRIELPEPALEGDALGSSEEEGDEAGSAADLASGTSLQDILGGGTPMGGGGDVMGQLAMQYAYPVLKPAIEEQVRRITVTVKWNEGSAERSFDVVQYYVATAREERAQ